MTMQMTKVSLYLTFDGQCAAAFDFYKSIFGGDFDSKFLVKDSPMKDKVPAADLDKVMHMSLKIGVGGGFQLMGSDYIAGIEKTPYQDSPNPNYKLSLTPVCRDDADRLFAALSADGGTVIMELHDSWWGSYHGQVKDRFGVCWMIDAIAVLNDNKAARKNVMDHLQVVAGTAAAAAELLSKVGEEPPQKKAKTTQDEKKDDDDKETVEAVSN